MKGRQAEDVLVGLFESWIRIAASSPDIGHSLLRLVTREEPARCSYDVRSLCKQLIDIASRNQPTNEDIPSSPDLRLQKA